MRRIGWIVAVAVVSLLGAASAAYAQKRVALVIGNSAYQHTPLLTNPKNDATDMGAALKKLGVQVLEGFDLDKAAFDRKVRDFAAALRGAEVGLFFFAGHGLQVAGQNYLVPTDAELKTASALDFEMVRLDVVQRVMEHETSTNVLFLDACRDNPLARNLARAMGTRSGEIGRGFAPVVSGIGTLISFSTQPGNVALDGTGRNSPFAGALVKHMVASRDDLGTILINVRNDVIKETQSKQVPWEHSALRGRFFFRATPGSAPATSWQLSEAAEAWDRTKEGKNIAELELFAARYKGSYYADRALLRIKELKKQDLALSKQSAPPKPAEKGHAANAEKKKSAQAQRDAAEGDRHYSGHGVPKDYVKARQLYEKAAVGDHAGAMHALGWMHENGFGVARDYAKARDWYERGAARGRTLSLVHLARLYREGWGVPQNYHKARDLYEKAAALGDLEGVTGLGWLHQNGLGVPQDFAKARELYDKAVAKGNVSAMNNLGLLHEMGLGVAKDYGRAREWFERAAVGGDGFAMNNLGRAYEAGRGVPQDHTKAREWFGKAAALENRFAKANLARLLDEGKGGPSDFLRAAKLLLAAARSGNSTVIEILQGSMANWTKGTRTEIKRELARLGHYRGPIDDTWDGRVHTAIGKFLGQGS